VDKQRLEWERLFCQSEDGLGDETWRARVPGGWIYRHGRWDINDKSESMAMVFVPLPRLQDMVDQDSFEMKVNAEVKS
jgi:hypothetical protein